MTGAASVATVTARSELLAQVRSDVAVVAHRFVQPPSLRSVMPGRHLDERRVKLAGDPFRLAHQPMTDTALTSARVYDEGKHTQDPVVVFEARQGVDRDEPEERSFVLGDED